MNKKGVSPVVATVLLIAIVVVIGFIVFFWLRGFVGESIIKFDTDIKQICGQVSFTADYGTNTIYITNNGNIPIYRMKVLDYKEGGHNTIMLGMDDGWTSGSGLWIGKSVEISYSADQSDKLILVPVLLGETKKGEAKLYTCNEKQGVEVFI